jgi:hypothetical protein
LKKAVNELDPVVSKISQGNYTKIHLREKATKACLMAFTRRTHQRQNMDTGIGPVRSHGGFNVMDGSNQNLSWMVCFRDSLSNLSFHSTTTPEDFHEIKQQFLNYLNQISSVFQQLISSVLV